MEEIESHSTRWYDDLERAPDIPPDTRRSPCHEGGVCGDSAAQHELGRTLTKRSRAYATGEPSCECTLRCPELSLSSHGSSELPTSEDLLATGDLRSQCQRGWIPALYRCTVWRGDSHLGDLAEREPKTAIQQGEGSDYEVGVVCRLVDNLLSCWRLSFAGRAVRWAPL